LTDASHQPFPVGVARFTIDGSPLGLLFRQRFDAPPEAKGIDVTLGENSPEPRRKAASSVVIAKQRAASGNSRVEPVQISIQGIRELSRSAGGINRIGGAVQHRSVLANEVLPCLFIPLSAADREREIFEPQGFQKGFELVSRRFTVAEGVCGTRFDRGNQICRGDAPPVGACAALDTSRERTVNQAD
jgi:hypothetical protein